MTKLKKHQLGSLLDRVYTIEGLIQLALSRPDYDEKIQCLISHNVFELADKVADWDTESLLAHREALAEAREAVTDENSSYTIEDDAESSDDSAFIRANEDSLASCTLSEADKIVDTEEKIISNSLNHDSIAAETARAGVEAYDAHIAIEDVSGCGEEENPLPDENEDGKEMCEDDEVEEEGNDDTPESGMKEYSAPEPLIATVHHPEDREFKKEEDGPKPRPVFGLNDRYMFARALFHNSQKEFENCLQLIATMDDYDEAEDYMLNELEWDTENVHVKQFMDIIHRYFDALQK